MGTSTSKPRAVRHGKALEAAVNSQGDQLQAGGPPQAEAAAAQAAIKTADAQKLSSQRSANQAEDEAQARKGSRQVGKHGHAFVKDCIAAGQG